MKMVQAIKVLVPPVELPGGSGLITIANSTVNLTDEQVAMIDPNSFNAQPVDAHNPGGSAILQNMGFVGQGTGPVSVQGVYVAPVSTANANTQTSSYVQADVQSIATLANQLKVTLNALLASLEVSGGPMKTS
jgi:hypothetical protein